ncbi:MAG: adenylate/guanylate cyclase domain-containing protein [Rhodospirillales bacterium]|nr:adenylate/guanylate cyclase domain-containing protein [Rhodospirillales bacterium]MBO6785249.1 adenylate/guanylate cyclase domain-containing protein [Rhodospirillales bacterium]
MFRFFWKFVLNLALSGFAATVITGVAVALLQGVNLFGTRMHGTPLTVAAVIIFFLAFCATAVPMMSHLMKNVELPSRPRRKNKDDGGDQESDDSKVSFEELSRAPRRTLAGAEDEERINSETKEMAAFRNAAAQDAEAARTAENAKQAGDDDQKTPEHVAPAEPVNEPPRLAAYIVRLSGFLEKSIAQMGPERAAFSKFEKFGICLFIAGASEGVAETNGLDEKACDRLIELGLKGFGYKPADAKRFSETYQDYLVQSAGYMRMFQTGRNAVKTFQADSTTGLTELQGALAHWKKPKEESEEKSRMVTVLFTDIAGSTAMTQELGDEGAQHVVRGHNKIVRDALNHWAGREVKHTGDGIMAAFDTTSNGVEAAMQMQRECVTFRELNPDLPLRLKIGINTGEPISEDNDLFGSTVQMSARIVDKAKADQIFVSEAVRGICAGKSFTFENKGPFPMKGFDEDPVLHEVVWQTPPKAEAE